MAVFNILGPELEQLLMLNRRLLHLAPPIPTMTAPPPSPYARPGTKLAPGGGGLIEW